MSCNARGRCHFCCKKHTVPVFGSDEMVHMLLQKLNFKLVVLNTICSPCLVKLEDFLKKNFPDIRAPFEETVIKETHIESLTGFTYPNTSNLEIMENPQVNGNVQIEEATETDVKIEKSVDSVDTDYIENKDNINNLQVCKTTGNIGKKQLTCEYCRKKFNHTGDFNKHRRKHTGEQPYACNTCERKFTTSSNLVRHQQIHLGIKPFHCQICRRSFSRKIKLSAHLVTKHYQTLQSNQ